MKQSKTDIFQQLRKAFSLALRADSLQTDAQEIIGEAQAFARSRRQFLKTAANGAMLAGASPLLAQRAFTGAFLPKIAIVGGGIAGLSALHAFRQGGYDATVYEASGRTGGRMFTVKEAMGAGTWTEFGGEFIDTDHTDMWALAKTFGLELTDFAALSETALTSEVFPWSICPAVPMITVSSALGRRMPSGKRVKRGAGRAPCAW